jgi:hypothetical protein
MRLSSGGATLSPGVGGTMMASLPSPPMSGQAPISADQGSRGHAGGTSPHIVPLAVLGGVVALWFAQQHSSWLEEHSIGINFANVAIITLNSALGIWFLKILFNRFPVANLTEAVNAL